LSFRFSRAIMSKAAIPKRSHTVFLSLVLALHVNAIFPLSVTAQNAGATAERRARSLANNGNAAAAIQILQQVLLADPPNLQARLLLGNLFARNHEDGRAEEEYREAVRRHPESSVALLELGGFYINRGSFDAAEPLLADAVGRFPKLRNARIQYALVLTAQHKYKKAETLLRLVQPPADPMAQVRYFRLQASIHSGLEDRFGAADAMEEALKILPKDAELATTTALAEAEAGRWNACIAHLSPLFAKNGTAETGLLLLRAQLANHRDFSATLGRLRSLNLAPDQEFNMHVHSAELLASAGEHREATNEFQRAFKLVADPDENLLYNLAVEQYDSGQFEQALITLKPLRDQQDSAEIEDLAGDAEAHNSNLSGAIRSHERAIALAPNQERYQLSLGAVLMESGAYQAAAERFEQAAQLFPSSTRVYVGLGMAYYFTEKYDESVAAFLHANELDPSSERAFAYLGATQTESPGGPSPSAVQAICNRANSEPDAASPNVWCGALLFRKAFLGGDKAAAGTIIPSLRHAIHLAPQNPVANCSLGQALAWTDQVNEARHQLEICVRLRSDFPEDHYQLSRIYERLGFRKAAMAQGALITKLNQNKANSGNLLKRFSEDVVALPTRDGFASN
jgi:tetratricopeptide (TPR) repeat protein